MVQHCKNIPIFIFLASYIIYGVLGYTGIIVPSIILWDKIFENILYIFPLSCYILFPIFFLRNTSYKYLICIYLFAHVCCIFAFYYNIFSFKSDCIFIDFTLYTLILVFGGVFLLQILILPGLLIKECLKLMKINKIKFIITLSISVAIILITPFIITTNLQIDNTHNSKYLTKYKNCIKSFGPPDILSILEARK